MGAVKFVSFVVRLGFGLALIGQLKFCTLVMLEKAAEKSQNGITNLIRFTAKFSSR